MGYCLEGSNHCIVGEWAWELWDVSNGDITVVAWFFFSYSDRSICLGYGHLGISGLFLSLLSDSPKKVFDCWLVDDYFYYSIFTIHSSLGNEVYSIWNMCFQEKDLENEIS